MIHTWRWFFCPAAVALVLGVTLLADAAVDPRWSWRIVGAVAVVITVAYVYLARPISVKSRDS